MRNHTSSRPEAVHRLKTEDAYKKQWKSDKVIVEEDIKRNIQDNKGRTCTKKPSLRVISKRDEIESSCSIPGRWFEEKDYPLGDYKKNGHKLQLTMCPLAKKQKKMIFVPSRDPKQGYDGAVTTRSRAVDSQRIADNSLEIREGDVDSARNDAYKNAVGSVGVGSVHNESVANTAAAAAAAAALDREGEGEFTLDFNDDEDDLEGLDPEKKIQKALTAQEKLRGVVAKTSTPIKPSKQASTLLAQTSQGNGTSSASGAAAGSNRLALEGPCFTVTPIAHAAKMTEEWSSLLNDNAAELKCDSGALQRTRPALQAVYQGIQSLSSSGNSMKDQQIKSCITAATAHVKFFEKRGMMKFGQMVQSMCSTLSDMQRFRTLLSRKGRYVCPQSPPHLLTCSA